MAAAPRRRTRTPTPSTTSRTGAVNLSRFLMAHFDGTDTHTPDLHTTPVYFSNARVTCSRAVAKACANSHTTHTHSHTQQSTQQSQRVHGQTGVNVG